MASPFISFFLLLGKPGGWGGSRKQDVGYHNKFKQQDHDIFL